MTYLRGTFSAGAESQVLKGPAFQEVSHQSRVRQLYQEYLAFGAQIQGIDVSRSSPPI